MNHTDDCRGGETCSPVQGVWDQPNGFYVRLADADDQPWCVTRERAVELAGAR